jgi:hypothetical protein
MPKDTVVYRSIDHRGYDNGIVWKELYGKHVLPTQDRN